MGAGVVHRAVPHPVAVRVALLPGPSVAAVVRLVSRPKDERPQPPRATEQAGENVAIKVADRVAERPLISDGDVAVRRVAGVEHPPGLLRRRAERLLAEHVTAVLQREARVRRVEEDRRRDDGDVRASAGGVKRFERRVDRDVPRL
jgi:hypothetical protein